MYYLMNPKHLQIHISYIDVLNKTEVRRRELQNTYYFLCECERCKEPEIYASAAVCSSCENPCDINEESCPTCAKEISSSFKEKFNEVSEFTAHHLETMKNVACILFTEKSFNILYPYNDSLIKTFRS